MREVEAISGPEIGPNPNKTSNSTLAIPLQDVFEIKALRAIVN